MNTTLFICQSCGMPVRGKSLIGTNSDKSYSAEYCYFCYSNGEFRDEGISLEEKININVDIAIKNGMQKEHAEKLAKNILPKLKRWKTN